MRYKYFYIGTKSLYPNRPQKKQNPKQITQCEVRVNVCTTGPRSYMACLDRNTDVTAVSTQAPVIRLTHGVESCFFHDSITVIVTIACLKSNHYLRKLISKVNPSFKLISIGNQTPPLPLPYLCFEGVGLVKAALPVVGSIPGCVEGETVSV